MPPQLFETQNFPPMMVEFAWCAALFTHEDFALQSAGLDDEADMHAEAAASLSDGFSALEAEHAPDEVAVANLFMILALNAGYLAEGDDDAYRRQLDACWVLHEGLAG